MQQPMTGPRPGHAVAQERVLHLLAPAVDGGLERVVAMLAHGQGPERAHVAAVIDPREFDAEHHPFVLRLRRIGVPVTALPVARRAYLREALAASTLADQLDASTVHTHGYRADLVARLMRRPASFCHVTTVHGFTGGRFRNRLNERVQAFALRRADAVIAVSEPLVARLLTAGVAPDRVHRVVNGFSPGPAPLPRPQARAALGIAPDARQIGWLGRVSPEKAVTVLINALTHLPDGWCVSVIGDGPEREAAIALARKLGVDHRIRWHGRIEEGGSFLRAFDAYVLSSRTEGTPIALFEALYAGVPIVATAVGGVPDVIGSGAGILVPPDDPAALANAIATLDRDVTAAASRAAHGSEMLAERFGMSRWVDAVDDVYRIARTRRNHEGPP